MKKLAAFLLAALLTSATLAQSGSSSSQPAPGLMPRGTSAVPGMYFAGDRDTGFYWESANRIGLTEGGVARAISKNVATVSALKALTGLADGDIVATVCFYTCTTPDGGGAAYRYDASSSASGNDCTVVDPDAAGNGRFELVHDGVISVKQCGAKGDGATDDATAIQTVLTSVAGSDGAVAVLPAATYRTTSTLVLPLVSNRPWGVRFDGATISYTGSGYAFDAAGVGESTVGLRLFGSGRILGSASGLAGVRFRAFNRGSIEGLSFENFTTGDGIFIQGANTIDVLSCNLINNKHGLHNKSVTVSSVDYTANAIRVIGGHISGNSSWGIYEDATGVAGQYAVGNYYSTTFDPPNGAGAGVGNIFVQGGANITVHGSYLEYSATLYGQYNVVVGDATYTPVRTAITSNVFLSAIATTSTIYDNGAATVVGFNNELGAPTNFVTGGAGGTARFMLHNRSVSSVGFAGTDNGDTLDIGGYYSTTPSSILATMRADATGVTFKSIAGAGETLKIRARNGTDTDIVQFQTYGGSGVAAVTTSGFTSAGVAVPTISSTSTLTNKTLALGSNTVSGTTAQFNTALSDGDFATLAGSEALTNKTLTTPILTLEQGTAPAQTAEGRIQWDTDDDRLVVGTGASTRTYRPTVTVTAVYDPASLGAQTARCDAVTATGITTSGGAVAANIGAVNPATGCVMASVRASAADTVTVCWMNTIDAVTACDTASSTWTFSQPQ